MQLATDLERPPPAGGYPLVDLVRRFAVVVHGVAIVRAPEHAFAEELRRRGQVHLDDPRLREVREPARAEVPLADQRHTVREQLPDDRELHRERCCAETARLVAAADAERLAERLLQGVLCDQGQAEPVAQRRADRRLAGRGRAADDDENGNLRMPGARDGRTLDQMTNGTSIFFERL